MSEYSAYSRPQSSNTIGDQQVIRIENLAKAFGNHQVLIDVSLELFERENLVILGRSGTGKSVLIKCIVGLITPDKGRMIVLGQDVADLSAPELDVMRRKIGFSFQLSALYDSMTVRQNLEFPLRRNMTNLNEGEINDMVEEALENVSLAYAIDRMPSELSGGMKKRVGIARTLILNPSIMLYDEPTAGLDPITAGEINELILEVRETYNTASIIITHDIACARMTGDRMILMDSGYLPLMGTYEELAATRDPRLQPFFDYSSH
ncbi:MAG: ATP-binding cassette domain-containing protein [Bacteroidota bacterium]